MLSIDEKVDPNNGRSGVKRSSKANESKRVIVDFVRNSPYIAFCAHPGSCMRTMSSRQSSIAPHGQRSPNFGKDQANLDKDLLQPCQISHIALHKFRST